VKLTQISRPSLIEPTYNLQPRYCLLVLGEDCASAIWIVACEDFVFVDFHGDGDITRSGSCIKPKRVCEDQIWFKAPEIRDRSGGVYKNLQVCVHLGHPSINVHLELENGHTQTAAPTTTNAPDTAPVIHFGGLLQFGLVDTNESLAEIVDNELCLATNIGTAGLGHNSFSPISHHHLPDSEVNW